MIFFSANSKDVRRDSGPYKKEKNFPFVCGSNIRIIQCVSVVIEYLSIVRVTAVG